MDQRYLEETDWRSSGRKRLMIRICDESGREITASAFRRRRIRRSSEGRRQNGIILHEFRLGLPRRLLALFADVCDSAILSGMRTMMGVLCCPRFRAFYRAAQNREREQHQENC